MSEACESNQHDKSFKEISDSYDSLIRKTECELEKFKREQERTKQQILELLDENCALNTRLEQLKTNEDECKTKRCNCNLQQERCVEEIVENLTKQNQCLCEENCTLKDLWEKSQEIIRNLEQEASNYRNHLTDPNDFEAIKKNCCKTIKILEHRINCYETEVNKQNCKIQDLLRESQRGKGQIACLQAQLEEKERELQDVLCAGTRNERLMGRLSESSRTCAELEKSCQLAKQLLDERMMQEKCALQKVQEALSIAEAAVADKVEAMKREQAIREECDNLATTVGQVLEEAAQKVEQDIACLKQQFADKERQLQEEHKKQMKKLEDELMEKRSSDRHCENFQDMLEETMRENEKLDNELQLASQAIVEMELRLEASENLLKEDNHSNRLCEESENAIIQYMRNNQQLKEKWKCTFEELTSRYKTEICKLQQEYSILQAENKAMYLQLMQANPENC